MWNGEGEEKASSRPKAESNLKSNNKLLRVASSSASPSSFFSLNRMTKTNLLKKSLSLSGKPKRLHFGERLGGIVETAERKGNETCGLGAADADYYSSIIELVVGSERKLAGIFCCCVFVFCLLRRANNNR